MSACTILNTLYILKYRPDDSIWELKVRAEETYIINILKRSFDEVINDSVWDYLFKSFNDPNKAWVECEKKCHKSLVDYKYAVGYETN